MGHKTRAIGGEKSKTDGPGQSAAGESLAALPLTVTQKRTEFAGQPRLDVPQLVRLLFILLWKIKKVRAGEIHQRNHLRRPQERGQAWCGSYAEPTASRIRSNNPVCLSVARVHAARNTSALPEIVTLSLGRVTAV